MASMPYVDPARVRYRQRKAWRDAAIGIISLIVTATIVTFIVVRTPGWPAVQETFFSPEAFSESFPRPSGSTSASSSSPSRSS